MQGMILAIILIVWLWLFVGFLIHEFTDWCGSNAEPWEALVWPIIVVALVIFGTMFYCCELVVSIRDAWKKDANHI